MYLQLMLYQSFDLLILSAFLLILKLCIFLLSIGEGHNHSIIHSISSYSQEMKGNNCQLSIIKDTCTSVVELVDAVVSIHV
jgi:hypothetical protein